MIELLIGAAVAALFGGSYYVVQRRRHSQRRAPPTPIRKPPTQGAPKAAAPRPAQQTVAPPQPQPTPPPAQKVKRVHAEVYGPYAFSDKPEREAAMRKLVARLVSDEVVSAPSDEQWDMIFARSPAVCIAAGAGSGKSTTLALRVYYMVEFLKIPLNQMTVVTFTRAAVKDLKEKLNEVFSKAGSSNWTENSADSVVRTFHSILYRMAQITAQEFTFFELLGKDKAKDVGQNEALIENPLVMGKPNTNPQLDALREPYLALYKSDENFKRHIHEILRCQSLKDAELRQPRFPIKKNGLGQAQERDKQLVSLMNAAWKSQGLWPIEGINPEPVLAFDHRGFKYYANGMVEKTKQLVFLGNIKVGKDYIVDERTNFPEDAEEKVTWSAALWLKRNIISAFCPKSCLIVNSQGVHQRLLFTVDLERGADLGPSPIFDVKLPGEFGYHNIFQAFWNQGSFIENLGKDVVQTCAQLRFAAGSEEYHFNQALRAYWERFEKHLKSIHVQTFNRAFIDIATDPTKLGMLPREVLQPLTFTLIDELQDISPQIVAWLIACQRRLRSEWSTGTFIMGIGDDWQSIYGWRGSNPEFFIKFFSHFKCHPGTPEKREALPMSKNYRSIEPIVVKSKRMIDRIAPEHKIEKVTQAEKASLADGIVLHNEDPKDVGKREEFIKEKLAQAANSKEKTKVIVISRSKDTRDNYESRFKGSGADIKFYTFHGAKGLQGEIAIVLEEASYEGNHVFRNAIYLAMGREMFSQTYDEAQRDEAFRLAYVALTRGVSEVHWFVNEPKQAALAFQEDEKEIDW